MTGYPVGTRALLALALPSAAFAILTNGYRIVDQYYVQGVSVAAQAAVGASVFVLILFFACFEIIADGAGPLLARAVGARDDEQRRRLLGEAIAAALLLTLMLMGVGVIGAGTIAAMLGLSGTAAIEFQRYLQALSWTLLPLAFTPLLDQTFLSMGNARAPLILHGISLGLNIVLCPLFIYGLDWGVAGAAVASNLARAVATALGGWQILKGIELRWGDLRLRGEWRRIVRVGLPMALGTALFAGVYWGLLRTSVAPLGEHVTAALGIGFSALEGFTWPLFHGLSLGVASLVGRNLGAGRKDLARQALVNAVPIAAILGLLATAAFYFGGTYLSGWFTDDPRVHQAATEYAIILAASQFLLAFEALSEGVLAGAGDTRTVFRISAPCNLARIPLAWWLAFPLGFGAAGIWWAINLTTYAKAILKGRAAWRGRWSELRP